MDRRGLILTSSHNLQGSLVAAFASRYGLDLQNITLALSHLNSKAGVEKGAFSVALSISDQAGYHSAAVLGLAGSLLKPGATLVVQEPIDSEHSEEALNKALLLGGFQRGTSVFTFASTSGASSIVALESKKPEWEAGTTTSIALKPRAQKAAPPASAQTWTLDIADDDDEELMDEDDLLTEEDKKRPLVPAAGDCETGAGKKACKDCSCGRADAEGKGEKVVLTKEMLENPQSGCGSCGLGDAFRCGGCPYRGLPAFEMGKKIQLPPDFLTADA